MFQVNSIKVNGFLHYWSIGTTLQGAGAYLDMFWDEHKFFIGKLELVPAECFDVLELNVNQFQSLTADSVTKSGAFLQITLTFSMAAVGMTGISKQIEFKVNKEMLMGSESLSRVLELFDGVPYDKYIGCLVNAHALRDSQHYFGGFFKQDSPRECYLPEAQRQKQMDFKFCNEVCQLYTYIGIDGATNDCWCGNQLYDSSAILDGSTGQVLIDRCNSAGSQGGALPSLLHAYRVERLSMNATLDDGGLWPETSEIPFQVLPPIGYIKKQYALHWNGFYYFPFADNVAMDLGDPNVKEAEEPSELELKIGMYNRNGFLVNYVSANVPDASYLYGTKWKLNMSTLTDQFLVQFVRENADGVDVAFAFQDGDSTSDGMLSLKPLYAPHPDLIHWNMEYNGGPHYSGCYRHFEATYNFQTISEKEFSWPLTQPMEEFNNHCKTVTTSTHFALYFKDNNMNRIGCRCGTLRAQHYRVKETSCEPGGFVAGTCQSLVFGKKTETDLTLAVYKKWSTPTEAAAAPVADTATGGIINSATCISPDQSEVCAFKLQRAEVCHSVDILGGIDCSVYSAFNNSVDSMTLDVQQSLNKLESQDAIQVSALDISVRMKHIVEDIETTLNHRKMKSIYDDLRRLSNPGKLSNLQTLCWYGKRDSQETKQAKSWHNLFGAITTANKDLWAERTGIATEALALRKGYNLSANEAAYNHLPWFSQTYGPDYNILFSNYPSIYEDPALPVIGCSGGLTRQMTSCAIIKLTNVNHFCQYNLELVRNEIFKCNQEKQCHIEQDLDAVNDVRSILVEVLNEHFEDMFIATKVAEYQTFFETCCLETWSSLERLPVPKAQLPIR